MFPESSKWSCAQFPHCSKAGCEWTHVQRHRPATVPWVPWNRTTNCISLRGELDWQVLAPSSLQTRNLLGFATRFLNITSHALLRTSGLATHDCVPRRSRYMLPAKTCCDMPSQRPTWRLSDCESRTLHCQHEPWDYAAREHRVNAVLSLPDSSCRKEALGPNWQCPDLPMHPCKRIKPL